MKIQGQIKKTIENLDNSYSPYSKFKVSALLETEDGAEYLGVNIENAGYSATNCAERTAFFKAISEGKDKFKHIIIVGGPEGKIESYTPPCGVCRQVMMEFCSPENFKIILAKSEKDYKEYTLKELLPLGFGPANL